MWSEIAVAKEFASQITDLGLIPGTPYNFQSSVTSKPVVPPRINKVTLSTFRIHKYIFVSFKMQSNLNSTVRMKL